MAGVTHFERRGGVKKVHPRCPFCGKLWRVTPRVIAASGGPAKYAILFETHLVEDLMGRAADISEVQTALRAASSFAVSVYANC